MSDKPVESAPEQPEPQGEPTPTFSEPSGDQPTSPGTDLDAVSARFEKLLDTRLESLERRLQSQKDKRWSELERQYGDLGEIRHALEAAKEGSTEEGIILDILAQRAAAQRPSDQPSSGFQPAPPAGNRAQTARDEARDILRAAGIDENSPEVTELMRGTYRNADHFLAETYRFAQRRQGRAAQPASPAAVLAPGGGAPGGSDQERLRAQYQSEKEKVRRGSPDYMRIRNKYKELGLNFRAGE